jgi:hypothetical protein
MINIVAALEVLGAAASKEDATQLISDAKLLYGVYTSAKEGKADASAMSKSGELKPAVDALARTAAVASSIMADATSAQHVAALLESVE